MKNKKFLILLIFLGIVFLAGFFLLYNHNFQLVKAESGDNVFGWAWSDNIGWISFNSLDCDADNDGFSSGNLPGCPPVGSIISHYGVFLDYNGTKIFDGYAWSSAIGAISFNEADLVGVAVAFMGGGERGPGFSLLSLLLLAFFGLILTRALKKVEKIE